MEHRKVIDFSREWNFRYVPDPDLSNEPADPEFDDTSRQVIAVPHTWSTWAITRRVHPFIADAAETDDPYWWYGWGWYQKGFRPNSDLRGKKVIH